MAPELPIITDLEHCQPLFREYCRETGLKDGDRYSPLAFILWCDGMTMIRQMEIVRKYVPGYTRQNCNL